MPTKARPSSKERIEIPGVKAGDFQLDANYSSTYRVKHPYSRIADAIENTPALVEYLKRELDKTLASERIVEKVVEKVVVEKAKPGVEVLSADEVALIGEVLMIHEHRIHDETKHDFLENDGANWMANHARAQTTLTLRKKLGLKEHVFSVKCCVPVVEEADVATLAITAHGIDAGKAKVTNGQ